VTTMQSAEPTTSFFGSAFFGFAFTV